MMLIINADVISLILCKTIFLTRYVSNRERSLTDSKVFCEIPHDSLKSEIALFSYIINVFHSTKNIFEVIVSS